MATTATVYRTLPAEERQEFRLPALLKEHLSRAAAESGQSVSEYITTVLAERVTEDLARSAEWALSIDEQVTLLQILSQSAEPTERARLLAERADALFGALPD